MKNLFASWQLFMPLLAFLIGWILPNEKVCELFRKLGVKMPKSMREIVAARQGLLGVHYSGDSNSAGNNDIENTFDKLEVDLGLGELKYKKRD